MALSKDSLKTAFKTIFETSGNTPESAADALATAIYDFVKSAEVTVTALTGEIQVVGTPSAQANSQPISLKGGDATHVGGLS